MTRRKSGVQGVQATYDLDDAVEALTELLANETISDTSRRKIVNEIAGIRRKLDDAEQAVDPVKLPDSFFDPTEPKLHGHFVAIALLAQERKALSNLMSFYGSGVYAIYYLGDFPAYSAIKSTEHPIYVGKADPASAGRSVRDQGPALSKRLGEHAGSIRRAANLELSDFEYRALTVQTGYQAAAEELLIKLLKPVWNKETKVIFGIGKHGDSAETRSNKRSPWDTLHAGRNWAVGNEAKFSEEVIEAKAIKHFSETKVFKTKEDILEAFLEGIRRLDRID